MTQLMLQSLIGKLAYGSKIDITKDPCPNVQWEGSCVVVIIPMTICHYKRVRSVVCADTSRRSTIDPSQTSP